jgi:hypothetical protein
MSDDPRVLVLAEMRKQTALLERILTAVSASPSAQSAPAVSLDGPHGDPIVKAKDPRDWTGEPMNGRTFSQCPAEYLDLLAERYDYFAERETDATKQRYNRLDAARARGWAARVRNGYQAPVAAAPEVQDTEPQW